MTTSIPQLHALQDLINQFIELYPNRGGSLVKHESGTWREVSRFYDLPDDEILRSIASQQALVRAVNWDSRTKFTVLNIDVGSKHHNQLALWQLQNSLGQRGIHKTRIYQSSESNGWHIYIFWNDWVGSIRSAAVISAILKGSGFEVASGTLDVFPSATALRLPVQCGFAWLNESGRTIVRRSEISLEGALALFLDDVAKFANDAAWLDSDYANEVSSLLEQHSDKTDADGCQPSAMVDAVVQPEPSACEVEPSKYTNIVPFAKPLIANSNQLEDEAVASEVDETAEYQNLPTPSQDCTEILQIAEEAVTSSCDRMVEYQNLPTPSQHCTEILHEEAVPSNFDETAQYQNLLALSDDLTDRFQVEQAAVASNFDDTAQYQNLLALSDDLTDRFQVEQAALASNFDNTAQYQGLPTPSQDLTERFVQLDDLNFYPAAVEQVMQISPAIMRSETTSASEVDYYASTAEELSIDDQTDNVVAFPALAESIDRLLTEFAANAAEGYEIESHQLSLQLVDTSDSTRFEQQNPESTSMDPAFCETLNAESTQDQATPVLDFSPEDSVVSSPLRASGIVRELIEEEIPEIAFDAEPTLENHSNLLSENNGWAGTVQPNTQPQIDDSLTNGNQRLNNVINSGPADIPRRKRPPRSVTKERPSPGHPPTMP